MIPAECHRMRVVFFGSAPIAFPSLDALLQDAGVELCTVVTQPDRPAGRHRRLTPCPVKSFALERGVPVCSPEKPADAIDSLRALRPDLFIVVAYGEYLPPRVLEIPRKGAINLHPSLLPAYRGAAPIQWAIANGEPGTGVTILRVSQQMDAGEILMQEEVPIDPDVTAADLEPLLAQKGAGLLMRVVGQIRNGTAVEVPQDDAAATVARKLTREDGRIDWHLPAETIRNRIRGFTPWPGCFCRTGLDDGANRLKVLRAAVEEGRGTPGTVLEQDERKGPLVACGENALRLIEVQPPGGRPMSGAAWLRGHSPERDQLA